VAGTACLLPRSRSLAIEILDRCVRDAPTHETGKHRNESRTRQSIKISFQACGTR